MRFIVRGLRLVSSDRRLWPYIWKPMAAAGVIYVAILAIAYRLIVPAIEGVLRDRGLPEFFAAIGFWLLAFFVSAMLYIGIAGVLSSLLWDKLSLEVERSVYGDAPVHDIGCAGNATDALGRGAFAIALTILSLIFGCLLPLLAVPIVGLLGLYDYTANAFLRRQVAFISQLREAHRCEGAFGFLLVAGVLTLFPILNLLMLPAMVAGGTLMVAESEKRSKA